MSDNRADFERALAVSEVHVRTFRMWIRRGRIKPDSEGLFDLEALLDYIDTRRPGRPRRNS